MGANKIRAAIIGCGVISRAHARAIQANSHKVELYAVCDIIEEKAIELAKEFEVTKHFINYNEMLEDSNIDFVCICTPSGMHADMVADCAKAGKHVLCEKPADITSSKLDKIVESVENSKIKFGAVFQYRTYPGILRAKKMLDRGELGDVYIGDGYCKIYRSAEYYKSAGWRGTWKFDGGGCLMNQGIHTLDVLCWLMGGVISSEAKTFTLARDIEVEDTAFAFLKFKNGGYGTFQGTTLAYPGTGVKVEIICEKGKIVFTDPKTYLYKTDEDGKQLEICLDDITEDNIVYDTNKSFEATKATEATEAKNMGKTDTANDPKALSSTGHDFLVSNLVDAIIWDRAPFVSAKEGRHAVDVILSIYESSKTGKEVVIRG